MYGQIDGHVLCMTVSAWCLVAFGFIDGSLCSISIMYITHLEILLNFPLTCCGLGCASLELLTLLQFVDAVETFEILCWCLCIH